MFITSRAKFASRRSPNGGAEISTIPRFLRFWQVSRVSPFMLPCVLSRGDLVARWNRIPAIFDPYTFSPRVKGGHDVDAFGPSPMRPPLPPRGDGFPDAPCEFCTRIKKTVVVTNFARVRPCIHIKARGLQRCLVVASSGAGHARLLSFAFNLAASGIARAASRTRRRTMLRGRSSTKRSALRHDRRHD
jgi:hypothetical protein